jgi:hypothetical protein
MQNNTTAERAVRELLADGPILAPELRVLLMERGIRRTAAGFRGLMRRLEDMGVVERGRSATFLRGRRVLRRSYHLAGPG